MAEKDARERQATPALWWRVALFLALLLVLLAHGTAGGSTGFQNAEGGKQPMQTFIGSWTLPSGNSCDVYIGNEIKPGQINLGGLICRWDVPPSPATPRSDVDHWEAVTFPAILKAVGERTGKRVMGARLTRDGGLAPVPPA